MYNELKSIAHKRNSKDLINFIALDFSLMPIVYRENNYSKLVIKNALLNEITFQFPFPGVILIPAGKEAISISFILMCPFNTSITAVVPGLLLPVDG